MCKEIVVEENARELLRGVRVLMVGGSVMPKPGMNCDLRPEWETLHARWRGRSKAEVTRHPIIAAYRAFQTRPGIGAKPTVSVETIIVRFLIADVLTRVPVILPLVDAVNVVAVDTMIPLGIFDADCVRGVITLGCTNGAEYMVPIGSTSAIQLPAGALVLRDSDKVLSHFCHRDADAQKVTAATKRIQLLACQVPGVEGEAVEGALWRAVAMLQRTHRVDLES